MTLKEEFIHAGNWLFRWRSYLPLLLLALFIFGTDVIRSPRSQFWEICCLGVSLVGLAIRMITIGYVPRGTSGRNTREQKAAVLNTQGMYAMVRHPLYLGNYVIWAGISLLPQEFWFFLLVTLIFWLYYERIMFAEEDFLQQKFGESFSAWAEKTPAFFPRIHLWTRPDLSFSVKHAIKREYSGFFAIIVIFTVFHVLPQLVRQRQFIMDPWWVALFTIGLSVYLTVRILSKYTTLLNVEGR